MTRKTNPSDHVEDARIASSGQQRSAAPAVFDFDEIAAASARTAARIFESAREIQLAQLNATTACWSAIGAAVLQARFDSGLQGAVPVAKASEQACVSAIRQSQDAWRRSMASLQEDLVSEMRGRADAVRAHLDGMWPSQPNDGPRPPESATDVLDQARQNFDAWMARWTAMVPPRPVPIA